MSIYSGTPLLIKLNLLLIISLLSTTSTHLQLVHHVNANTNTNTNTDPVINIPIDDGPANLAEGNRLFQLKEYDAASSYLWLAVIDHGNRHNQAADGTGEPLYSANDAFEPFIQCYMAQDKLIDGFLHVARESILRGQNGMSELFVKRALELDPENTEALDLLDELGLDEGGTATPKKQKSPALYGGNSDDTDDGHTESNVARAQRYYTEGTDHFDAKNFDLAAEAFDRACPFAEKYPALRVACTNAVYCRSNIMDWGYLGRQFEEDMDTIATITRQEIAEWRSVGTDGNVHWRRPTSVHPHMMLGYPLDTQLKRHVAESNAITDEPQARFNPHTKTVSDLPPDVPYSNNEATRRNFVLDAVDPNFKIRIAFLSCGFKSKAVLYLSHDIFRFFDRDRFEIHVFSMGSPDHQDFIQHAMRGVDWRERVRSNVDYFHDVQHLSSSHVDLARFIHDRKIHVLVEWDGYARQGMRAQGVFALRPAPIQVLHQEYLGTTGGYMDYIVTDRVTSPEGREGDYTEKFMYMPNHFFSKGHAVQAEVKDPTYHFEPRRDQRYRLGEGTPQENRCGSDGDQDVSFVYCNFNKFLKNNPETTISWIDILRRVPNSILCLLENPSDGVPNLRRFVREIAYETATGPSDGDELNSRIHFLPWQANPFDHQMRNQDYCNVVLDSYPYNGHTTAQDALYGGVPIVTRSDGDDMASRVSTSANVVLGLDELNAYGGVEEYVDIAVRLGEDGEWFEGVRERLIDTCRMREPMHPYWDVERYVEDIEGLFGMAWERYLSGKEIQHLSLKVEEEDVGDGTIDKRHHEEL